jgi:hypothetical protein
MCAKFQAQQRTTPFKVSANFQARRCAKFQAQLHATPYVQRERQVSGTTARDG